MEKGKSAVFIENNKEEKVWEKCRYGVSQKTKNNPQKHT